MKINAQRLLENLDRYAQIGKKGRIGVERIALSEEDKQARDLLKSQMIDAGLSVHIDRLGNMIGIRKGKTDSNPVAFGSHLDTVYSGGRYDGALGVLAGLELIQSLNDTNTITDKPLALVNFTNEEGVRFAPDMMGSHVYAGMADLEEILNAPAYDNPNESVGSCLHAIGYNGEMEPGAIPFDAFFELHIEQGPVLELEKIDIGVVEQVQGIYWTRYRIKGEANHAGTTPVYYRKDAGYAASRIQKYVGDYTRKRNGSVLTTVGSVKFSPDAINIVPEQAELTLDVRSTDEVLLKKAQKKIDDYVAKVVEKDELSFEREELVRFGPVRFPLTMTDTVQTATKSLRLSYQRMPSGAGHDAQMMAHFCPSTMIFIPSVKGISHNVEEYSHDKDVENGANVLMESVLRKSVII